MDFSALDKYLPMRWRHAVVWRRVRDRTDELVEAERDGDNDADKLAKLEIDLGLFRIHLEEERLDHLTRKLRRDADRLHVDFPGYPMEADRDKGDEHWQLTVAPGFVLTTTGMKRARKAIREEKNARRERFLAWAPFLIGLVTALTGLLAVIVALVAVGRCGS